MMKKTLVFTAVIALLVPCVFAGTMGTINEAVDKKMREINSGNKTGQNVQEIKFKKATPTPVATNVITPQQVGYVGTLSILNISAGIFQGGIIGMTIGLAGYSQSMNRNIDPVIYGSVIGTVTGATLAVALSVAETITGKYYMSDDYGFDLLGGFVMGSMLGAAAGTLNWQRTGHLENISEGAGWGALGGSIAGLILGTVESFFVPENIRGGSFYDGGTHASVLQTGYGTTILAYNFSY
jgi:hypothetical protein